MILSDWWGGRGWECEGGRRGVVGWREDWWCIFLVLGGIGVHRWHLWAQLEAKGAGSDASDCLIAFKVQESGKAVKYACGHQLLYL